MKIEGVSPGTINWIHKYARANYWKVAGYYDYDDLIQEGFCILYDCKKRYGNLNPPHLMRMVQICFFQFIVDTAKRRNGLIVGARVTHELSESFPVEILAADLDRDGDAEKVWDSVLGAGLGNFGHVLAEAPSLVRKVLNLFINPTNEQVNQLREPYSLKNGVKETIGQRIRRILNIQDNIDIMKEIYNYLKEDASVNVANAYFGKATVFTNYDTYLR